MDFALCDPHKLFVSAMYWALEQAGHDVVAVVDSPDELAAVLLRQPVDVCLMGLNFEADVAAAIRDASELAAVIVLTGRSEPELRRSALEAGAVTCIHKVTAVDTVIAACEAVHAGTGAAVFELDDRPEPAARDEGLGRFLTPRERQILQALVDGDPSSELPARFGLRPATVRTHVQNVLMKLGVHSRVAAAAYAVEHGLVEPPSRRADLQTTG